MELDLFEGDIVKLPVPDVANKLRSFSTSTPFTALGLPGHERKLRTLSISVCSTTKNDSGLGASVTDITVTSPLDSAQPTVTVSYAVCTPTTNLDRPQLYGRNTLFGASPVSSRKIQSRRSLESYFSYEEDDNDGCIQVLHSRDDDHLSSSANRSRLSNSFDKSFVRKLDLDLDIYTKSDRESPIAASPKAESGLGKNFYDVLEKYSPPEPDRLIGRNMGLDQVDIISLMSKRDVASLSCILSFLEPKELCSMCMVCRDWKTVVESDSKARQRKRRFVRFHRDKKNNAEKENEGFKRVLTPLSRGNITPLQNLPVSEANTEVPQTLLPERDKTVTEQFIDVASTLKNGEKLQKCPKCRKPAKVLPVQDRGHCQNPDCSYDFCSKCSYPFHHSKDCVPIATKKTKTDAIGTKKSKKNLKRL